MVGRRTLGRCPKSCQGDNAPLDPRYWAADILENEMFSGDANTRIANLFPKRESHHEYSWCMHWLTDMQRNLSEITANV